jgi:hypothetical protein
MSIPEREILLHHIFRKSKPVSLDDEYDQEEYADDVEYQEYRRSEKERNVRSDLDQQREAYVEDLLWVDIDRLDEARMILAQHCDHPDALVVSEKTGKTYTRNDIIALLQTNKPKTVMPRLFHHGIQFSDFHVFFNPYNWEKEVQEKKEERAVMRAHNLASEKQLEVFQLQCPPPHPEAEVTWVNCSHDESPHDLMSFYRLTIQRDQHYLRWTIIASVTDEDSYANLLMALPRDHEYRGRREFGGMVCDNELTQGLFEVLRLDNHRLAMRYMNWRTPMRHRSLAMCHLLMLSQNNTFPCKSFPVVEWPDQPTLDLDNPVTLKKYNWMFDDDDDTDMHRLQQPLYISNHQVEYADSARYRLDVGRTTYGSGRFYWWSLLCNTRFTIANKDHHPLRLVLHARERNGYCGGQIVFRSPLTTLMLKWLSLSSSPSITRQSIVWHLDGLWD